MAYPLVSIEGTWEEIVTHAPEFAGRRLRVTVLAEVGSDDAAPAMRGCTSALGAALREIRERGAHMNPKPGTRDYLREGRAGGMFGYEPHE
jgi:hypothetical protein